MYEVAEEITFEQAQAPSFVTDIVEIESVQKNPDSDFLYIYKLKNYELYLQSSTIYEVGDRAVCFHVDSVLSPELEAELFPEGSKIKLDKRRIRAIRVRNFISQGLLIKPETLEKFYKGISKLSVGTDVREKLGVTKYEPPVWDQPKQMQAGQSETKNPLFREFTDPDHFKKNPDVLEEGVTLVVYTEKAHGTSARFGRLPFKKKVFRNTFWNKVKRFFKLKVDFDIIEEIQDCIGSRRVQIHMKPPDWKGFYDMNFWQMVEDKYQLTSKLPVGYELFGEIVSPKVQKGFHYGVKEGDVGFYAYDLMIDGKYVDYLTFKHFCDVNNIPRVPELYLGPFSKEELKKHEGGASVIEPTQKVREGLVIRPLKETINPRLGRVLLKHINPEYLLLKTTDWE